MLVSEIIRKKRDMQVLSNEDIAEFVSGVKNGTVGDAQIAACFT